MGNQVIPKHLRCMTQFMRPSDKKTEQSVIMTIFLDPQNALHTSIALLIIIIKYFTKILINQS